MNQLVGYNLAVYRNAAGLTQEELGKRLGGWTKVAVSAAERSWDGKRVRKFDADELMLLATVLGVPVTALFLPPADAGVAVRYVLDAPGFHDLVTLLPDFVPTGDGDSAGMREFRTRLMALGVHLGGVASYPQQSVRLVFDGSDGGVVRLPWELLGEGGKVKDSLEAAELVLSEARERAEALDRDAQERHRLAVGSLVQQCEELERRVDDLRAFEREYRGRLGSFLEAQLREFRATATDAGVFPAMTGNTRHAVLSPQEDVGP